AERALAALIAKELEGVELEELPPRLAPKRHRIDEVEQDDPGLLVLDQAEAHLRKALLKRRGGARGEIDRRVAFGVHRVDLELHQLEPVFGRVAAGEVFVAAHRPGDVLEFALEPLVEKVDGSGGGDRGASGLRAARARRRRAPDETEGDEGDYELRES